ncbi:MAG: acyl carrier protein [Verrucomicrobia bacterium]|nr:acyl carrier protein [Verrucomicrobiota bacterium]
MAIGRQWLCRLVLTVHRRNGGQLQELDTNLRLLDPSLRLDSLDLAEIMVAIERETGQSPFDLAVPPRTWEDVLRMVESK